MITLHLTAFQAEVISDILDLWIEGCDQTTNDIIADRTLPTADWLLKAVDTNNRMKADATELKNYLRKEISACRTKSARPART